MFSVTCRDSTASTQCRHRRQRGRLAITLLSASGLGLAACASLFPRTGTNVVTTPAPSESERYCAWYGDSDGRTLYAGLAPFWSAMRAADDDPQADLTEAGPQWIGRFDLAREEWLEPLDVGPQGDGRSGVWDVHAADANAVYFTTFFETSGRVDAKSGSVVTFAAAGVGLNELAPGPEGRILVSRYGSGDGAKAGGELLSLEPDGRVAQRWFLPAPLGFFAAPKTPAWNPVRRRLVATTDLLAEFDGDTRHDAYLLELDEDPPSWQTSQEPELQFVSATPDGVEYRAEVHPDRGLWLRRIRPPGVTPEEQHVLLDADFPPELDFVQDLKIMPDGRLVLTRWSGTVHVVDAARGTVHTVRLPRLEQGGLYYTAVIHGKRLCATYCAGVTVVCTDAPD